MKAMKYFTIILALILPIELLAQEIYKSKKYGYTMELPTGYEITTAIGEHIDLKTKNKDGNSIIVLLKKLPKESLNITAQDMLKMTGEQWETSLNEYLPNPQFIKKGAAIVDGKNGYFIHYTSQKSTEPKLYHMEYCVFYNGLQYLLTFTCEDQATDHNMPYFFRALRSFKF